LILGVKLNASDLSLFLTDRGDGITYWLWLIKAWGWTLSISVLGFIVALVIGSLMGTLRTVPGRFLSLIGNAWTELFRNIPLILQIFVWYYAIPAIFPVFSNVPPFILVVFALGFFTSARISEQVKAGIESLPKGQRYAGLAMGLSLPQTYRYVLLPMAFRTVMPPFISESMNIVKNSSVAFAVTIAGSIGELTFFAQQGGVELSKELMVYAVVTIFYFLSALVINKVMSAIDRKIQIPGMLMGGAK
jgi:glutamate/aspartate transport system permease protein